MLLALNERKTMSIKTRIKHIGKELICHSPFTIGGALVGIIFMLIFRDFGQETGQTLFKIFHPGHVILSAMVTASLFSLHSSKKRILPILLIGYFGSIGIATLSDCIIPHFGEEILGVSIPKHACIHDDDSSQTAPNQEHIHGPDCTGHHEQGDTDSNTQNIHDHSHGIHLGFIEEWYLVNPAALLGILLAWKLPKTRFPHALHVLVSTWASSAHMLMNTNVDITGIVLFGMFAVLFVAVWLPCCISDIIFPLLFVKGDIGASCRCTCTHHHDKKDNGDTHAH